MATFVVSGFPQALEIMENHLNKFHAWENHGILKNLNNHGKNYGILVNNLTKSPVARKLAVGQLGVRQLVFWLLVVSSFNIFFKMHAWSLPSTSMLLLLHSAFMLSVVKGGWRLCIK